MNPLENLDQAVPVLGLIEIKKLGVGKNPHNLDTQFFVEVYLSDKRTIIP